MIDNLGMCETYKIYIGMNDKETLSQLCSTEDFIEIIQTVCEDRRIAFSMTEQIGGYTMHDGTFITERSLVLAISGLEKAQIMKLAESLRIMLNQETVMVSLEKPELFLITDTKNSPFE